MSRRITGCAALVLSLTVLGTVPAIAPAARLSSTAADAAAAALKSIDVARIQGQQRIPEDARPVRLPEFVGSSVKAQPFPAPAVPANPYLSSGQWSNLSNDALRSNTTTGPGPLGNQMTAISRLAMQCTSATFIKGTMVGVCYGISGAFLQILDPTTLRRGTLFALPSRDPFTTKPDDFRPEQIGGGAYYVDSQDRIVMPTATGQIWVISLEGKTFSVERRYDLRSARSKRGEQILSAHPDWSGRIWFVMRGGNAGYVEPDTGAVHQLALGELIDNGISTAPDGGVFVSGTQHLFRLDAAGDGTPQVTWSDEYPNDGVRRAPVAIAGSGTTPTILQHAGKELVAIMDNQNPAHVRVLDAASGTPVCSVNAFKLAGGSTEAGLIGIGGTLIATNQRGYNGPGQTGAGLTDVLLGRLSKPGMTRIDINEDGTGCDIVWRSDVRVPSGVPKLSLATGLIYAAERQIGEVLQDVYYLQAIDVRTGEVRFKRRFSSGLTGNNNYSSIVLGPDGAAYTGGLLGIYRIADSADAG